MIYSFKVKDGKYFDIKKLGSDYRSTNIIEHKRRQLDSNGWFMFVHKKNYNYMFWENPKSIEYFVDTNVWYTDDALKFRNISQVRCYWNDVEDFLEIVLPKIREEKLKRILK